MNRKELTKTFMIISKRKKPLVSMNFTEKFSALRVKRTSVQRLVFAGMRKTWARRVNKCVFLHSPDKGVLGMPRDSPLKYSDHRSYGLRRANLMPK